MSRAVALNMIKHSHTQISILYIKNTNKAVSIVVVSSLVFFEAASFTVRSTPDFRNTNWIEPKTVTRLFWLATAPTQKQGQPEQSCDCQNSHVTIIGSI
jgi:hypothetical protein